MTGLTSEQHRYYVDMIMRRMGFGPFGPVERKARRGGWAVTVKTARRKGVAVDMCDARFNWLAIGAPGLAAAIRERERQVSL